MYIDEVYKQLVKEILTDGVKRDTRNGKTLSVFGASIKFDIAKIGLPILSYRKIFTKGVVGEFLGSKKNQIIKSEQNLYQKGQLFRNLFGLRCFHLFLIFY